MSGSLADRAHAGEDRMVAVNVKPTLFRGNVTGNKGHGHVNVQEHAALQAVDVIVPFDPAVVAAGLIGEGQLLDQPVFRQQMQRSINGAVANVRVAAAQPFENLARCQVPIGSSHLVKDRRTLGRVLEPLARCHATKVPQKLRMSLTNSD